MVLRYLDRFQDEQLQSLVEKCNPYNNRNDFWSFGYNLRYDCWGNGYATEATKVMMKFANEHFDAGNKMRSMEYEGEISSF